MSREEEIAIAMREAYAKFERDVIVPWSAADPRKKRAWRCCARAALAVVERSVSRVS